MKKIMYFPGRDGSWQRLSIESNMASENRQVRLFRERSVAIIRGSSFCNILNHGKRQEAFILFYGNFMKTSNFASVCSVEDFMKKGDSVRVFEI